MKTRSRILSLLLAALLTAQFSSCAKPQEETADETEMQPAAPEESITEEETTKPELQDDLPEADFDGYNFRILSCEFVGRELASFIMADEMNGDAVNDTLFQSTSQVEERFDVDITYQSVLDYLAVRDAVSKAVRSESDEFDIQSGQDVETASLAKQGMFYNMYDVEQFNFDKPWWPKNIMSQLDVAGKLYLGSSYLTYNGLHWTRTLIANKEAFADNQIEIPYEDIISGTWYWDEMLSMIEGASRDLDGNGIMDDNDFYAFSLGGQTSYCLQDTFGISFYEEREDGIYVNADQERTQIFLDKMGALFTAPNLCVVNASENEYSQKLFPENRTLLATTMVGTAYDNFRDTEISYSILPFPKLDEVQQEYINTCTDAFWAIPITAVENIDIIGTVIEALSCQNYQHVLPVYFEIALKAKLSESPNDAAMFDIIKDTRTIGFEYAYSLPFKDIVAACILGDKQVGFSSYYTRQSKSAQRSAEQFYEKMANLH